MMRLPRVNVAAPSNRTRRNHYRTYVVPSVDFARFFRRAVEAAQEMVNSSAGPAARPHVLLKMDIEGAEYKLLPHLLVRGDLCLADHIIIDWHLKSLPTELRMEGFALRRGLGSLLREGCGGHALVTHEEFRPLTHVEVPGLTEDAVRRQPLRPHPAKRCAMCESGEANGSVPRYGMHWRLVVDKVKPKAISRMLARGATQPGVIVGEEVTTERWR